MSLISIIIPISNRRTFLPSLFSSIRKQTLSDFEVILVDDCSSDGSYEACLNANVIDNRFKVYRTDRKSGVSVARNVGLDAAKGKFITFVDSDDNIDEEFLATMFRVMYERNADIVSCAYCTKEEDLGERNNSSSVRLPSDQFFSSLLFGDTDNHVWGRLYRRSVIDDIRFDPEYSISEDLIFLISLLKDRKLTTVFTKYYGYFHLINKEGLMTSYNREMYYGTIRQLFALYSDSDTEADFKPVIINRIMYLKKSLVKAGGLSTEQKQYLSAMTDTIHATALALPKLSFRKKILYSFLVRHPVRTL